MGANEPGQPPLDGAADATVTAGLAVTTDLAAPGSALAIGAHPDDVEFGAGGTLAKWARAGCEVRHAVLTDGSKGTWDPDADLAALVAQRRDEQRHAARTLGASADVRFFDRVDGELVADRLIIEAVARLIREVRPQVVLTHDPWKRYRLHPDHRNTGTIVCDAIVAARDPHFFPSMGLAPHRPEALLLWEADAVNHAELLDDDTCRIKLAALEAHESQFVSTMGASSRAELDAFGERLVAGLRANGERLGLPVVEVFHLITDL